MIVPRSELLLPPIRKELEPPLADRTALDQKLSELCHRMLNEFSMVNLKQLHTTVKKCCRNHLSDPLAPDLLSVIARAIRIKPLYEALKEGLNQEATHSLPSLYHEIAQAYLNSNGKEEKASPYLGAQVLHQAMEADCQRIIAQPLTRKLVKLGRLVDIAKHFFRKMICLSPCEVNKLSLLGVPHHILIHRIFCVTVAEANSVVALKGCGKNPNLGAFEESLEQKLATAFLAFCTVPNAPQKQQLVDSANLSVASSPLQ